jgi:hypothetical protein
MMTTMMTKLVTSPVQAESPLAKRRMIMRGLAKRSTIAARADGDDASMHRSDRILPVAAWRLCQ